MRSTVPSGQRCERLPDARLDRAEPRERLRRALPLAVRVELRCATEGDRLGIGAHAQLERQGRRPLPGLRRGRGDVDRIGLERDHPHHECDGRRRRSGREHDDAGERRHGAKVAANGSRAAHEPLPHGPRTRLSCPQDGGRGPPSSAERCAGRGRLAIFTKVMPSYRELLASARAEIDEISTTRGAHPARRGRPPVVRRRPPARRVGRGTPPRRDPPPAQQPRVARRGPDPRQVAHARRVLRERAPLGLRHEDAPGARLRERRQPRGGLRRLEAERLRVHDARRPDARAARLATRVTS